MSHPQVILRSGKIVPFLAHHPWVRQSAIDRIDGHVTDGDVVDLVSDQGRWIARGIYNGNSRIRVRLYIWNEHEVFDDAWIGRRLGEALELRRLLGYLDDPQGAVRLVFSEADYLSGLIVDRFADHLVVQVNALGIARRLSAILPILKERIAAKSIAIRMDAETRRLEGGGWDEAELAADAPTDLVFISEHGLRFGVDTSSGQKTGFYLDQRENRQHVAKYMRNRNVLDLCCYTGAFSLTAASLGQASHVVGIDSSEKAVTTARANAELNRIANVQFLVADMFQILENRVHYGEKYGAVILDPPKFVRNRAGVPQALRAYHRLNRLAVEILQPGGILVTCSCSGNVSRQQFCEMLFGVGSKLRRNIQILEQHGASPDHPIALSCPETEYLKCLICRVG